MSQVSGDVNIKTIAMAEEVCIQWYDSLIIDSYIMLPAQVASSLNESISILEEDSSYEVVLAKGLLVRANYESYNGKFEKSIHSTKEAIEKARRNEFKNKEEFLMFANSLIAYSALNLQEAEFSIIHSKKALQVGEALGRWEDVVGEYINMAQGYMQLGQIDNAFTCFDNGINLLDSVKNKIAKQQYLFLSLYLKNNEGLLHYTQGQTALAAGRSGDFQRSHIKAIASWQDIVEEIKTNKSFYQNLGRLYINIGSSYSLLNLFDPDLLSNSISFLREATNFFSKDSLRTSSADHGFAEIMLGSALCKESRQESLYFLNSGLKKFGYHSTNSKEGSRRMFENASQKAYTLIGLNNKANSFQNYYLRTGDIKHLRHGLAVINEAIDLLHYSNAQQITSIELLGQRYFLENIFLNALRINLYLYEATENTIYFEEAFSMLEQKKSFLLRQNIRSRYILSIDTFQKQQPLLIQDAAFENKYQDLQMALKVAAPADKNAVLDRIISHYDERQQYINQLKNSISKDKRSLFHDRYDHSTPTIAHIREHFLNDKSAVISYSTGGNYPMAFVVSKMGQWAIELNLDDDFRNNMKRLIECQSFGCVADEYATAGFDVYEHLFKGVENILPEEINELLIVPDNGIRELSFDMLLTTSSPPNLHAKMPFLFREYAMEYCYSLGTLDWNKSLDDLSDSETEKYFGSFIASPSEAGFGALSCSDLPLSDLCDSTQSILRYFSAEERAFFDPATLEDFTTNCGRYQIIQITAHGCADRNSAMENSIQFAPPRIDESGGGGKEFQLTVREIYNRININADLMVLASCNTKIGQAEGSEGLISICRALRQAGARQLLVSLSLVNDYGGAKLLSYFYEELIVNKRRPIWALTEAKKRYLDEKNIDDLDKEPYYWSGLVLVGRSM